MKREPTFSAFLPLGVQRGPGTQVELSDNSGTSSSLYLPHSLPTLNLAKTKNRSVALLFLSHGVVSCVVCWMMRPPPSIYSHEMVGLGRISLHAPLQPSWRDHQETTRGSGRQLAQLVVRAHPRCDHTQVLPPRNRLPHGGCMFCLDRFHMGFGPKFIRWAGLLFICLWRVCVYVFLVVHFDSFYMYSKFVSCKCTIHHNLWKSLFKALLLGLVFIWVNFIWMWVVKIMS